MNCPRCGLQLMVYKTAGRGTYESRDYKCRCGYRATSLNILIERRQENPQGAVSGTIMQRAVMGVFDDVAKALREKFPKVSAVEKTPSETATAKTPEPPADPKPKKPSKPSGRRAKQAEPPPQP